MIRTLDRLHRQLVAGFRFVAGQTYRVLLIAVPARRLQLPKANWTEGVNRGHIGTIRHEFLFSFFLTRRLQWYFMHALAIWWHTPLESFLFH